MHYVYLLKSTNHNQVYTGLTTDVERRLYEHNSGHTRHTNKYKPWKLTAYFAFASNKRAEDFEKYLKTGSGIAFTRRHFL